MKSKATAVSVALLVGLTACGTSVVPSQTPGIAPPSGPSKGGTIYVLAAADQWDQIDPQRVSSPEDQAFFGATIYRSLEGFAYSPDTTPSTVLTPDLATDLGSRNAGATQWRFTLRNGVAWQDGSPITCEDVKYGVSRAFASEVPTPGPIDDLSVPYEENGGSVYQGPYTGIGQAVFDRAVTCDGKTITFNLSRPVPNFNYAVALGFEPVPKAADLYGGYGQPGHLPVSSGPYRVESYSPGSGGKMVLVRNPNWNPSSDSIRKAYPDRWEVDFGVDPKVIDQRLIASAGADASAIGYGPMQAEDRELVFTDPDHPKPGFAGRAVNGYDGYARYMWVNLDRVPDLNVRKAMWVALDRAALMKISGGAFANKLADGVLVPSIGPDYAPTGLLDGTLKWLQGRKIPDSGDPAFAKQLISKAPRKTVTMLFDSQGGLEAANIVQASLGRAGLKVYLQPRCTTYYTTCGAISVDFGFYAWRAPWPSANAVIPELFGRHGRANASGLRNPVIQGRIEAALEQPNRDLQAAIWRGLNMSAMGKMWVLPTFFETSQSLAGTRVGGVYRWPAYNTWPFGAMYVKE